MSIKITWKGDNLIRNLKSKYDEALSAGASELRKDSNDIAPQDKSDLINTSIIKTNAFLKLAKVKYVQKYARRLHDHPEYNFSKDKNPRAQGKYLSQPLTMFKAKYLRLINEQLKRGWRV